jgi:hypothetical protein
VGEKRDRFVKGHGDVQIKIRVKTPMFKNVFYIPDLRKNLHLVTEITKHNPVLDVIFQEERYFLIHKRSNKKIASGIKEQRLYRIVGNEVAEAHAMMTNNKISNNIISDLWKVWAFEFLVPFLTNKG